MPLLELDDAPLVAVKRCDVESRLLADRHYSRQTIGSREFMGNGRTLVLRDTAGTLVFGWLYPKAAMHVIDAVWCSIFHNESAWRSSDAILEAERMALEKWSDAPRFATYIDPRKITSRNPGYCFKVVGYKHVGQSTRGLHLLVKER